MSLELVLFFWPKHWPQKHAIPLTGKQGAAEKLLSWNVSPHFPTRRWTRHPQPIKRPRSSRSRYNDHITWFPVESRVLCPFYSWHKNADKDLCLCDQCITTQKGDSIQSDWIPNQQVLAFGCWPLSKCDGMTINFSWEYINCWNSSEVEEYPSYPQVSSFWSFFRQQQI